MLTAPASTRKRLLLLVAPVLVIVTALLLLVAAAMETLSAGRAYVGGEGLWSKAQKDAVHHLLLYARGGDERSYGAYEAAIAVPLGDRKAREALDRPTPDYDAARQGFLEGRNHADDVDAMARLFVRFRKVSYIDRAIGIWTQGDAHIDELRAAAEGLRAEARGARDPARIEALLAQVHEVNRKLGPLEDDFSYTLGEATRWMRDVLFLVLLVAAGLLVAAAALRARAQLARADGAEAARRESDERLALVANSVPALIAYVDREQRYRFSNRTYEEWFGFPHERMQGRTVREVFGDKTYESRLRDKIERVLAGERMQFEYSVSGEYGSRLLQVTYEPHLGGSGEVLGFYSLASDITALKLAEQQERNTGRELAKAAQRLEFLAHHDPLTALPNRAMLQDRVAQAVSSARRHRKGVGLLFVDLDHFKHVNDTHGHAAGDALLKAVAGRLRDSVRQEDIVARLGGDEFCVLLQEIDDPAEAGTVAQKLLASVCEPYRIAGQEMNIGASIGIACLPRDGVDMETLIKNADIAMYRAKEAGRNSVRFFTEDAVDASRAA